MCIKNISNYLVTNVTSETIVHGNHIVFVNTTLIYEPTQNSCPFYFIPILKQGFSNLAILYRHVIKIVKIDAFYSKNKYVNLYVFMGICEWIIIQYVN